MTLIKLLNCPFFPLAPHACESTCVFISFDSIYSIFSLFTLRYIKNNNIYKLNSNIYK